MKLSYGVLVALTLSILTTMVPSSPLPEPSTTIQSVPFAARSQPLVLLTTRTEMTTISNNSRRPHTTISHEYNHQPCATNPASATATVVNPSVNSTYFDKLLEEGSGKNVTANATPTQSFGRKGIFNSFFPKIFGGGKTEGEQEEGAKKSGARMLKELHDIHSLLILEALVVLVVLALDII